MKSKIFNVVRYTVEKNIRNKWFIILNILLLLVTIVAFNFNTVKNILKNNNISFGDKTQIIVLDNNNLIYDYLNEKFTLNSDIELIQETENKEYTKDNVENNQVIVTVEEDDLDVKAKVISQEGVNANYIQIIEDALKEAKEKKYASTYNIDLDTLNKLKEQPEIERIMLGVDNNNTDSKYAMQTVFNYIIFFILLLILSKIANDISQEKINKSIEYVLTSISAKGYLIAKVLSINLTFIVQIIFTMLYFLVAMLINSILNMYILGPSLDIQTVDLTSISTFVDTNLIIYCIIAFIYLLLTIFILCIIQAIFSSKTTNITEAGNATVILITANLIIYMLSTFLVTPLKAPTMISYIVSCIPIASMYFVPTMVLLGQANIIQVIIATILLILSGILLVRYGATFFKNGVLDYSNKKSKKNNEDEDVIEVQKQKIAKTEYSKIGYVLGFSVILFILLQLIFTYILQILNVPLYNILNKSISLETIETITRMISFVISLIVPALFVMSYSEKEKIEKCNKKSYFKYVLIALPLVLIVQIVVGIILEKIGLNYDVLDKVNMFNDKTIIGKVLFFIEVAVLPAIFEEFYIRKAVLNYTKKYGICFAVIASSLLFSVVHFNLSQMLFAFIMGVILSIITLKTNSIVPSGMIHLLNNGYAALVMIFESNNIVLGIINIIYFSLILIGIVLIIIELVKNKGKFIKIKNTVKKESNIMKKYRYIFCDYTFIISIITCAVLLVATQKLLMIL